MTSSIFAGSSFLFYTTLSFFFLFLFSFFLSLYIYIQIYVYLSFCLFGQSFKIQAISIEMNRLIHFWFIIDLILDIYRFVFYWIRWKYFNRSKYIISFLINKKDSKIHFIYIKYLSFPFPFFFFCISFDFIYE